MIGVKVDNATGDAVRCEPDDPERGGFVVPLQPIEPGHFHNCKEACGVPGCVGFVALCPAPPEAVEAFLSFLSAHLGRPVKVASVDGSTVRLAGSIDTIDITLTIGS